MKTFSLVISFFTRWVIVRYTAVTVSAFVITIVHPGREGALGWVDRVLWLVRTCWQLLAMWLLPRQYGNDARLCRPREVVQGLI